MKHYPPEILAVNTNIKKNTDYSLYDAQLAVAEAHKRCLERKKSTLCISECGSGKTKIGITALHAYQQKKGQRKHFNAVLCPSHMTKKWLREIEESLPDTFAVVVGNITELNKVYSAYEQDDKTCYIIISKEKARDGYMKRPAAVWRELILWRALSNTYRITACCGYDLRGRKKFKKKTIKFDSDISPKQLEKELERLKYAFEEEVRKGIHLDGERITFGEYSAK